MSIEMQREVVLEAAERLDAVVAAVNEFAENTERVDSIKPLSIDVFNEIDSDGTGIGAARAEVQDIRVQYRDAVKQLERYSKPPQGVGPFPLDSIERALNRYTSYTPTWEPSDDQETANNLSIELDSAIDNLDRAVTEMQRVIDHSPRR